MARFSEQEKQQWEDKFRQKIIELDFGNDPAHDLAHFLRVSKTAKRLCSEESALWEVVIPAAWLHDFVNVPKNDPKRSQASRLSAIEALKYLRGIDYPEEFLKGVQHAIEAHSFSAQIEPTTLEAKIVQDADRLDGLGAIGLARCFCVAGLLHRQIYESEDPFGVSRKLDDLAYTIDHFYVKLFKVAETLQTKAGRAEGIRRVEFMRSYLKELGHEIGVPAPANSR